MKEIVITGIVVYVLWVVIYLFYERISCQRKKQRHSTSNKPARKAPDDDIIVKSTFDMCHSLPEASKPENQKKAPEKPNIFAPSNEAKLPVRVPDEALDEMFSYNIEEVVDNPPLDIDIPLEYENDDDEFEDEEDEESWMQSGVTLADGSSFEEMGAAMRTVIHHENATLPEKEQAGGVLLEIKQTDLFEQVVQSAPGRDDVVGELMSLHLTAYHRRLREEAEAAGTRGRQAPRDFDIRNFV